MREGPDGVNGPEGALFSEALAVMSLTSCPFSSLGSESVKRLLSGMEFREYRAKDYLVRQGDPGDHLLLILSGAARAFIHDGSSGRTKVGEFRAGDVVGEIGLLTGEARTADVVSEEPVRALRLDVASFQKISETYPEVRMLLTNVVADRLGKASYDGLGGKDVHGYRIVRCVGRGGMGIVYEAGRISSGEIVALKMLNHALLYQPGAIGLFKREAESLEALHHDSIARLYETFSAYGTQFLVMEFCDGSTLNELLTRGRVLSEAAVRKIVGQLAVVLRYIHSRGLVHRDLKPSNVMLSRSGIVKLLDFGLVKADPTWPDGAGRTVSQSGALHGTLQYMAPEQFGPDPVDYRVDVYGLACLAYEALSGRRVSAASDLLGAIQDKMRFVLPPRQKIGSGVTPEMHEFLKRGLDQRPERRTVDLDRFAAWAGPINHHS